jgi:hypothetical protein
LGELPAFIDTLDLVEENTAERSEIEARIAELRREIPSKVDATAGALIHLKARVAAAKQEAERQEERKAIFQRAVDRLEGYVNSVLEELPKPSRGPRALHGNHASLVLAKCPPAVHVSDENAIPAMFLRVIPASSTPDKKSIKEAIEAGVIVPGAELRAGVRLKVA